MPWKQKREAGVLLMAHGAAGAIEEIKPYLRNIRGGREPDPNLVQQIIERYRLMGGRSPLLEITQQQALALQQFLHDQGVYVRTYVGMRHWRPTIQEAITQLLEDALDHVVAICLTPYYSRLSVGAYFQKLHEARKGSGRGFEIIPVESWNDHPLLLQAFAEKIRCALDRFPLPVRDHVPLLFTAHSLPERILAENDPYPRELLETVEGIVKRVGPVTWRFAYQSQSPTGEAWLGPDVGTLIDRLQEEGHRHLLVVPVGFVSDHLETLYDIDILYRQHALSKGMQLERTESLNTDPTFIQALAAIVQEHLPERIDGRTGSWP